MRRATVRDLRNRFARILTWIEEEERWAAAAGSRHPRPRAAQGAAGLVAGLPGQAANGLAPWTQGQIDRRADRRGAGRSGAPAGGHRDGPSGPWLQVPAQELKRGRASM